MGFSPFKLLHGGYSFLPALLAGRRDQKSERDLVGAKSKEKFKTYKSFAMDVTLKALL